jgi:HSP20 family protein
MIPEKIKADDKKWLEPEGELAVDVYSTDKEIVVQSAVAGVKSKDLDVSVEDDMIIIKGSRNNPCQDKDKKDFFQECYWGKFSRKIIIPDEIDPSRIEAAVKEGTLTIRIPRIIREKSKIEIKEVK